MDLTIAKMFLKFRETIYLQVASLSEMTLAHDHQLRHLKEELNQLKREIKKNNELIDDLPF